MILVCTLWLAVLLFEFLQPGFYIRMMAPIWLVTILIAMGEVVQTATQASQELALKRLEFTNVEDETTPKISAG